MTYRVVFAPEAQDQLSALYAYIAAGATPGIAIRYAEAIIGYCETLATFPYRGVRRDDIRPGLRITNYKKRTIIAFAVEAELVSVIGVFYGGQNYEVILQDDVPDQQVVEN
jgi:toxin ParE1/3/4